MSFLPASRTTPTPTTTAVAAHTHHFIVTSPHSSLWVRVHRAVHFHVHCSWLDVACRSRTSLGSAVLRTALLRFTTSSETHRTAGASRRWRAVSPSPREAPGPCGCRRPLLQSNAPHQQRPGPEDMGNVLIFCVLWSRSSPHVAARRCAAITAGQRRYYGQSRPPTTARSLVGVPGVHRRYLQKGLPGRRVMTQNSPQDGHGEHRNSSLRVRRSGRRCDGSQVNR
jgi:hypothetical protein